MPSNPRKRQKQLERKNAKRKSKHLALVRQRNAGMPERLQAAAKHPIADCFMSESLQELGMGQVIVSRELPNGSIAASVFLIDRYCLGVKDVYIVITSRFDYETRLLRNSTTAWQRISPESARKIVESAVAYARSLGLSPHPDYATARLIFGDIDPSLGTEEIEFGKDGKPFFTSGPNDTPARCRAILRTLEEHVGREGYLYLLRVPAGTEATMLEDEWIEEPFDADASE